MLATLCNGDSRVGPDGDRGFSAYGGAYTFDVPQTGFSCPACGPAYAPPKERTP